MRRIYPYLVVLAALALVVGVAACKKKAEAPATAETASTAAVAPPPETPLALSADALKLAKGTKVAVMEMEKGGIVEIEMLDKETPNTAANFEKLIADKFYDGLPVHRVEDFVVQAGDATLAGRVNPDIKLAVEKDKRKCVRGAVSMARGMAPGSKEYGDTSPTQFFILKKDSNYLDPDFCVFGVVVSGMDVVDKIAPDDVIKRMRVLTVGEGAPTAAEKK